MSQQERSHSGLSGGQILRVECSEDARDFTVAALELGLPALDRSGVAYESILLRILGRFAACAEREEGTVKFWVQDDSGARLDGVTCRPVAADQLDAQFQSEREDLKRRLDAFQPATSTERILHRALSEAFGRLTTGPDHGHAPCSFFTYRDTAGSRRLVWCWGYRPVDSDPRPPEICGKSECRLLYLLRPGESRKCPRCRRARGAGRSAGRWKVLAAVLLFVLIVAGVAVWWYGRPTAVLTGEVTEAASGQAVAGASVSIKASPRQTVTDPDGRFRLDRLPSGPAEIVVRAAGFRERRVQEKLERAHETALRVPLVGDAVLAGEVLQAEGQSPLGDAEVRVVGSPLRARTDARGQFRIEGIRSGRAKVEAEARGFRARRLDEELASGGETRIRVLLTGAAILTGDVVDAADNSPVAHAEVRVAGATLACRTDADGRFRLDGLRSGPATMEVKAAGYGAQNLEKELAFAAETSIRVPLAGDATVVGEVVASPGSQPVKDAKVRLQGTQHVATTDVNGRFRLERVRSGPAEIEVAASGYATQRIARVLKSAEDAAVHVSLKGDAVLAGQVLDAASKAPIAKAQVTTAQPGVSAQTDVEGRFRIDGLLRGWLDVQVAADGYATWRRTEELAPAKETSVLVELKKDAPPVAAKPPMPAPEKPAMPVAAKPAPPEEPKREVTFFGIKSQAGSVGFVVDCSGSMAGRRIERTKAELADSIVALDPQQSFYVSFFQSGPIPMSGAPRSPAQASPVEKARALNWMKTIAADDGTQPESTLQMLAQMKPSVIYLLSDGEFPALGAETFQLLQANRITVNTVAFEDEGGAQRLREIAEKTGGTCRFVPVGDLPPHHHVLAATRLALLLIDALDDPPPNDTQVLREALRELCDRQDFGPEANAPPAEIARAADAWTQWWVDNRLVPVFFGLSQDGLMKELRDGQAVRRWGELVTARRGNEWWEQKRQEVQKREMEKQAQRDREQREARLRAMEKQAQQKLELANQLRRGLRELGKLKDKENRDLVKKRYQEVISEFPGTPAAQEAQRQLNAPE